MRYYEVHVLFCAEHDLDFTSPVLSCKVASGLDHNPGIADWEDPIWLRLPWGWNEDYTDLARINGEEPDEQPYPAC